MQDYLQNRKQRTEVRTAYSIWQDILAAAPRGSVLERIFFNIFLFDLFLNQGNNYFTNYTDHTTPYAVGDNTTNVLRSLTKITQEFFT